MENKINEDQMVDILNAVYSKALDGIPKVSRSIESLASDYIERKKKKKKAARQLINYQIAKCGTSGFLTGLGGLITLPVTLPANVSSVLYIQLRMIAAIAHIGGFDTRSDQVQTMVYACLTGSAIADVLKQTGIKVGQKITINAIKNIPGKVLTSVNQKVGFRLITKFGETGIINLGKMVPVVGGVVGGTVDIGSTKIIAENAYSIFIKRQVPEEPKHIKASEVSDTVKKGIEELGDTVGSASDKMKRRIEDAGNKLPQVKLPDVKIPKIQLSKKKKDEENE